MSDMKDRRRHKRVDAQGQVVLETRVQATLRDLSARGARLSLVCEQPPSLGQRFSANITLESEPPIEARVQATIVWAEHLGSRWDVGVEFIKLDPYAESDILRMLDLLDPPKPTGEPMEGVRLSVGKN